MVSTVISKIISMQPSFTISENTISQYIVNHAEDVISSTITHIAHKTETSEASINRFCKKLGYKGFNGFKIALAQENFYNNMLQQSTTPDQGLIASITADYRKMLINTSAMMDEETVKNAAQCIRQAGHITIFGLAGTAMIAQEFASKLEMVGIRARATTEILDMKIQAANISSGDLSIFIAPTIMMKDIFQIANVSIERGGKNLTITSYDSPKLNDLTDFKFVISDKMITNNSFALSNNLMFLYVVDILYCALLSSDKTLRQKKLSSDALVNNHQTMDSYAFEY